MATTAQILANRENSKLSTGPRTSEGKAASSANAITHGLSAADPVLPHEDRSQFNALLERYQSDFAPTTAHEEFLVSQMAGARWKLDRLERIESTMLTALENADDPVASEALSASPASIVTARAWSAPTTVRRASCAPPTKNKRKSIPPNLLKGNSKSC